MKVLVTGASGFAGKHLIAYLQSLLHANCIGVTRTARNDPGTVFCELTDHRQVDELVEKFRPTLIFHLAGSFSNDFENDYYNNVMAAKNILEAVLKYDAGTRIMLMGSAAEYGDVGADQNPVSEQQVLKPVTVYGWSKAAQTMLASYYASKHSLNVTVARTFNLAGKGMSDRLFMGRVQRQIRDIKSGSARRISVGSLASKRDYIDIDSACAMYYTIATRGEPGEVYNVGSGSATSMRELMKRMLHEAGLDFSVVDEIPETRRANEVSVIYADISKVTRLMEQHSSS